MTPASTTTLIMALREEFFCGGFARGVVGKAAWVIRRPFTPVGSGGNCRRHERRGGRGRRRGTDGESYSIERSRRWHCRHDRRRRRPRRPRQHAWRKRKPRRERRGQRRLHLPRAERTARRSMTRGIARAACRTSATQARAALGMASSTRTARATRPSAARVARPVRATHFASRLRTHARSGGGTAHSDVGFLTELKQAFGVDVSAKLDAPRARFWGRRSRTSYDWVQGTSASEP